MAIRSFIGRTSSLLRAVTSFRIAGAALLLCTACSEKTYPGEVAGTYAVVGQLDENTCGQTAVAAVSPLSFTIELRRNGRIAYWRRPGVPIFSGRFESDVSFRFERQSYVQVLMADPETGRPGCTLTQAETIAGTFATPVDAGAQDATTGDASTDPTADAGIELSNRQFCGKNTITFTPATGSSCESALFAAGGKFAALPCDLDYMISGTPTDSL